MKKTFSINNRRYLGNKFKLNDFITGVVNSECVGINTVADIFSGTGAVASAFLDKKIITNDILYSNYICHYAWFSPEKFSVKKIAGYINNYNGFDQLSGNYMSDNFSDTFFSNVNCMKIGYIRENIEHEFSAGNMNKRERALLICSLLYAMDRIANTCGHYDAYRKDGDLDRSLELLMPLLEINNNANNLCFNEDTNELIKKIEVDLVYIDPPYNSRQYCDAYHLLENVARWDKPLVKGVARKMDRAELKSDYCTKAAPLAFEELVSNIKAKYILLSYNNMGEKGNDRSNAKLSDEDIMRILSSKGKVKIFKKEYKSFTAGKSSIIDNEERLFLCECYDYESKELIQSPLNYVGGKYKLLPQILPHFPKHYSQFIDLMCGGGNVGINVNCNKVVFNDCNKLLRFMFGTFKSLDKDIIFETIDRIIEDYNLSNTAAHGYSYYGCNSKDGLGQHNEAGYKKLRQDFNNVAKLEYNYYIVLYVIIVYAFNNQIRFNKKGEYNLPVGKRDFNCKMRNKLSKFVDRLKNGDFTLASDDFRELDKSSWDKNTFVYIDPPYLIGCATYNEQGGWTEKSEQELLKYLDELHCKGIKFALSNVFSSKGKTNDILKNWAKVNADKYRVIYLNYSYSNSNYQIKDKISPTEEVLIVNY